MEECLKKSCDRSGPKTLAGKNQSRGNSRKHGLAALLLLRDRSPRVEHLTKIFLNGLFDAEVGMLAQEAAAARVQLEEVMAVRASFLQLFVARSATVDKTPAVEEALGRLAVLKSLARYERRALTRWFKCLEVLGEAKMKVSAQRQM